MFTEYVEQAMRKASYELIEDGTFFGTIPGFDGLWANGSTLEECREELITTLEEWLITGLWLNDESIPKLGKVDIVPRKLAAAKTKHESGTATRTRQAS